MITASSTLSKWPTASHPRSRQCMPLPRCGRRDWCPRARLSLTSASCAPLPAPGGRPHSEWHLPGAKCSWHRCCRCCPWHPLPSHPTAPTALSPWPTRLCLPPPPTRARAGPCRCPRPPSCPCPQTRMGVRMSLCAAPRRWTPTSSGGEAHGTTTAPTRRARCHRERSGRTARTVPAASALSRRRTCGGHACGHRTRPTHPALTQSTTTTDAQPPACDDLLERQAHVTDRKDAKHPAKAQQEEERDAGVQCPLGSDARLDPLLVGVRQRRVAPHRRSRDLMDDLGEHVDVGQQHGQQRPHKRPDRAVVRP
eukprot:m.1339580 g.1339580  ORF g.1339580 m.1339580 type:complete len:310 (+) comp24887_c1_seq1:68-997(+)